MTRGEHDPIRVGVLGGRGRMGTQAAGAVEAAPTLAVVGPFEDADRFAGAVR